ncbi:MAG TPA: hypothetical protein VLB32_03900 [Candidatus Acidoferrales bacterium]|nr:hypothetical protein [Candidatus Acidoferrales bacterium]
MMLHRSVAFAALVLFGFASASVAQEEAPARYRVEQVFRLETLSAEEMALPGRLRTEPVTTAYIGRFRFVLEQSAAKKWKFTQVETEPPTTEPPERADAGVERVLQMGLDWMKRLDGQEFSGAVSELPAMPLGESAPAWLTTWLRWAQTGSFSGTESDPIGLAAALKVDPSSVSYQLQWLRAESRQVPCHVQQARWAIPPGPADDSLPAQLAAQGVEAHTSFSAQSLEWVSQENPTLIYAERSGTRDTSWTLEKVDRPELKELVFRLRLVMQVQVERLP